MKRKVFQIIQYKRECTCSSLLGKNLLITVAGANTKIIKNVPLEGRERPQSLENSNVFHPHI